MVVFTKLEHESRREHLLSGLSLEPRQPVTSEIPPLCFYQHRAVNSVGLFALSV